MTLIIATEDVEVDDAADDGYLRFGCPRCGRLILRYHPSTRGSLHLKCTRKGMVGGGRATCGWADYVHINMEAQ